jgi:hypothetical protein
MGPSDNPTKSAVGPTGGSDGSGDNGSVTLSELAACMDCGKDVPTDEMSIVRDFAVVKSRVFVRVCSGCIKSEPDRYREEPDPRVAPDGGLIGVCPECDSSDIRTRSSGLNAGIESDWYCRDCGARFDDPAEREPRRDHTGPTSTRTKKLLETDSDDVLPDSSHNSDAV